MIFTKIDYLISIELILYHSLWALIAYAIPRQKISWVYWGALFILSAQMIVLRIALPLPVYFSVKVSLLCGLGMLVDTVFTRLQWWQFSRPVHFLPLWLCLLWLSFALTMQYWAAFVRVDAYVWAILGGLGFPLAYFFGQKLKLIVVARPWPVYLYQGVIWSIVLPLSL